ncbi:PREDICTED: uncharacterized protein LOC106338262 [Brassica oleracea var. oleracea]|uniref:uncharacterized protein LOC106338262 n=1 Tax=Brassica oleracea var. oleracea TaxID=109376 RepID=UPI0006A6A0F5|nr:PREDICTED: uncharacterized protein LOC106338262 [Brassica oleracea var. oleracea]
MRNPTDQSMAAESEEYKRWDFISGLEENFLKQKSKMHWLEVGDKNNKVFHRGATIREIVNTIKEIQCTDGAVVTSPDGIKTEAERHFQEFLQHKPANYAGIEVEELQTLLSYRCSDLEKENLVKEVKYEEIMKILFVMPNEKSPGPDGYTVEFYKSAWSIIGADFVMAIQRFFDKGFLPKGLNTTILALIPKITGAKTMKDYRPISCCNVLYKVISKIIANSLKKLLLNFISLNQSAFVQDRLLIENLLLATELVKDYHKESISRRCAIKIDISKAFDSVQWTFLFSTLKALDGNSRSIQSILDVFGNFANISGLVMSVEKSTIYCGGTQEENRQLIWRVTSSHSLWARWVKEYLLKGETFWAVRSNSTLGSWVWRKLLKYRDKAKEFHHIEVNNGRGTSFWFDEWSDMGHLFDIVGARGCIDMGISLTATVESAMTRRPRRHRYDLYVMIEEAMNKQRRKMNTGEDVVVWKHNLNTFKPKFDTKNTWLLIRDSKPEVSWYSTVWFPSSTPKYSFMVWIAMHNRLSTGDKMLLWNSGINLGCVLCQHQLETREHLFFECSYSLEIWQNLTRNILPSRFSSRWQDINELLSDNTQPMLQLYLLRYSFQVILYTVWRERNNRRHGDSPTLASVMIKTIDRQI